MRFTIRSFSSLTFGLLACGLLACGLLACGGPKEPEKPACDIDINNLSGQWVAQLANSEVGFYTDKDVRVEFGTKDGKKYAIATTGLAAPDRKVDPTTHKYQFEFAEVTESSTGKKDALYVHNLLKDAKPEELEKYKQQDFYKDPRRVTFEGRLYVRADMEKCRLTISDLYMSYHKGKEIEDSNPAGTRNYVKSEHEYSMQDCPKLAHLGPFIDGKEVLALSEINDDQTITFKMYSDEKEDLDGKTDCTFSGEAWIRDLKRPDITVTVGEAKKGAREWSFDTVIKYEDEYVYEPPQRGSAFVELYRYRTCGGEKELIRVDCTGVKPIPVN